MRASSGVVGKETLVKLRSTFALLIVAVVAAAGARGVAAADRPGDGVRAALVARIDAALASGKLSPERAAKLKERLSSGLGAGRGFGHHRKAFAGRLAARARGLGAAADYLHMNREELRTQLRSGKSLAAIASAEGKTAAGLVAAMLAPAKDRLAKAVADGKLTRARADEVLDRLEERLGELVQRSFAPKR
jgi:hypothetical protein